ncbi:hypothetical protein [Microbacterium trichothecenolyticum]|uniref:O-antigen polysaccharide polymerase Wzy n=1 Tax=Microbacterium trichothecenolyticum TaxID=69370 RepID=A0ABU0TXU0_MICTR|nr:hypothetical protein [Microbacterium trichothecenolyticum]MDQ1124479.1 hypothetical protein [Microbacterium trichothecenolyticum]
MTDWVVQFAVVLYLVGPLILIWVLRGAFQIVALSPVIIVVSIFAIVGVLGFLISPYTTYAGGVSIIVQLTARQNLETGLIFGTTSWLILIGALASIYIPNVRTVRVQPRPLDLSGSAQVAALALAAIPIVMLVAPIGLGIFYRSSYLTGEGGGAFSVAQQLALASGAVFGFVSISGTRALRVTALCLAVVCGVALFSLGSRRLAMLPVAVAFGAILARPRKGGKYLATGLAVAGVLLPLPLYLRSSSLHGLLPYVAQLGTFNIAQIDWLATLNNVIVAFPITGATVFQTPPIPMEYFWISINPLPGEVAGFYGITQNLGLNQITPYSTIGEVWNHGAGVSILFWLVIGLTLGILERAVGQWLRTRYSFVGLGLVVLSALYAVTSLQYNLRSSTRMLVYAGVIALIVHLVSDRESRRRDEGPKGIADARLT